MHVEITSLFMSISKWRTDFDSRITIPPGPHDRVCIFIQLPVLVAQCFDFSNLKLHVTVFSPTLYCVQLLLQVHNISRVQCPQKFLSIVCKARKGGYLSSWWYWIYGKEKKQSITTIYQCSIPPPAYTLNSIVTSISNRMSDLSANEAPVQWVWENIHYTSTTKLKAITVLLFPSTNPRPSNPFFTHPLTDSIISP